MSEWLSNAFSGGVSLERVNPVGVGLMVVAVILNVAARPISRRWSEEKRLRAQNGVKFIALLVCCAGAAVAIL